MLAGSLWAIEPPMPAPWRTSALPTHISPGAEIGRNPRFDLVIVEPQGRGPQGFRFRIVLDSATWDARSSLNLAAREDGLLVTARDVDGVGNDLDLIIKSARSFTPIGVWINDHHGGFIKVDARVYAPAIWSDNPSVISANPRDSFHGAILLWHQSYLQPQAQRFPGERWRRRGFANLADRNVLSRLTAEPQHTRGPPSPFNISF